MEAEWLLLFTPTVGEQPIREHESYRMFTTTWLPGRRNKFSQPYLIVIGCCLLVASGFGIWVLSTMNKSPSVISGSVHRANGHVVSGARVYFTSGPVALPDITILSDAQGKFALSVPVAGTYQIGCTADGFLPKNSTVDVKSGQNAQIEIILAN